MDPYAGRVFIEASSAALAWTDTRIHRYSQNLANRWLRRGKLAAMIRMGFRFLEQRSDGTPDHNEARIWKPPPAAPGQRRARRSMDGTDGALRTFLLSGRAAKGGCRDGWRQRLYWALSIGCCGKIWPFIHHRFTSRLFFGLGAANMITVSRGWLISVLAGIALIAAGKPARPNGSFGYRHCVPGHRMR
jgi:hypothetical protein